MKKLILTILFCFVATSCFAEDYWMYIRTYDRYGVKPEDDAGRSKKGDIIDIRIADYEPSETEKKSYSIIKVSDLTERQLIDWKKPWFEDEFAESPKIKAYRKYKIDADVLNLKIGKDNQVKKAEDIKDRVEIKTEIDLISYQKGQKRYAFWTPLRRLANKFPRKAYAETVSTVNLTGEDYASLTIWEDTVDGDLAGDTRQETAHLYDDDGHLVDSPIIGGSTTTADYYMKVSSPVGERHDGTESSGATLDGDFASSTILIDDTYTVIEWLEITDWDAEWGSGIGITVNANMSATVERCLIYSDADTYAGSTGVIWWHGNTSFSNNIIYDIDERAIRAGQDWQTITGIYNNTVYNYNGDNDGSVGIYMYADNGGALYNNIVIAGNNGGDCFAFGKTTHDYNASSDATATGANSLDSGDGTPPSTSDFVSTSPVNLHLVVTAVEIDEGSDLGDNTYAVDIDNRDRDTEGDTWDIGADEYVSGAPPPAILTHAIINIF